MTGLFDTCRGLVRSFVGTSPSANMNDLEHTKKRGTFAQCSFIIVRSASLGPEQAQEVRC